MDHGLTAKQLLTIKRILAPYADIITRVDLFGSRATGTCRPDSDIDMVLHGQLDERTIDRLWTLFHESNLPVAVDVKSYDLTTYRPLRDHMDEVRQPLFTQLDLNT
ncbi:MAG: nucleotidyltransferase domain-containing protein [Deltaproteobacteria bacterium]|nr:nucleotidyltransferase domain-containing protein [Deltaproteobacteria bacterium]